jgi:ferric-dicitrate binding protein FerR (iron transport regulator)
VLEEVVRRLLEKDPDARPQNARELVVALDAAIRAMEAAAERALARPRALQQRRVAVMALGIVVVVAALTWLLLARL